MHILFVHGVAARRGAEYDAAVAARHAALTRHLLAGVEATFHDPYWGHLGISADRELRSIPRDPGTALGLGGQGLRPLAPEARLSERALLDAATSDLGAVLNSLSIGLAAEGDPQAEALAGKVGAYAAALDNGRDDGLRTPAWIAGVRDDGEFLRRLHQEVDGTAAPKALGLGDWLKRAGLRTLGAGLNLVSGRAAELTRGFTPKIATFIGDVFVYLRDGAQRDEIRRIVADDLAKAARSAREDGSPFVVMGHSMGAIILHDMLSDPETVAGIEAATGGELQIDLLLTVGTQIGLFEELGLFGGERLGGPASAPPAARLWWHVLNRMDVLSFGVDGVLAGANQFSIDTDASVRDAHSAYFISPVFHQRLRKRMIAVGLLR